MVSWMQRFFSRRRRKAAELSVIREPEGSFVGPKKFRRSERVFFANQQEVTLACRHIDPTTYDTLKSLTGNPELPDEVRACLSGFLSSNVRKDLRRIPKTPYASQRGMSSLSSTPEQPELDDASLAGTPSMANTTPASALPGKPVGHNGLVGSPEYAIHSLERIAPFVPGTLLHTTECGSTAATSSIQARPIPETAEYCIETKKATPRINRGRSSSLTKPRFQAEIYSWLKEKRRLSTFSESACCQPNNHANQTKSPGEGERTTLGSSPIPEETSPEEASPGSEIYEIGDLPYYDGRLPFTWPDSDTSSVATAPSLSHTALYTPSSTSSYSTQGLEPDQMEDAVAHFDSVKVHTIENSVTKNPHQPIVILPAVSPADDARYCLAAEKVATSPFQLLKLDLRDNLLVNADLIGVGDDTNIP